MKKFWNMYRAEGQLNTGIIDLYGEISDVSWWGDEVTPKLFAEELNALGDIFELEIHINSPGGDVFAGMTIYNIIKRKGVLTTVYVDGLAASIASVIAMAGDEIIVPENATLMIHKAWTMMSGNADDLRKQAEELDRIDGQIADIYAGKCGKKAEDMLALMEAETWMTGAEAKELGLATRLEAKKEIAACMTAEIAARYGRTPEGVILKDPSNGDESQPVEENKDTKPENADDAEEPVSEYDDWRGRFADMRRKIFETYEEEIRNEHF